VKDTGKKLSAGDIEDEVTLYPNPANDVLNVIVDVESDESSDVTIYSTSGEMMQHVTLPAGEEQININKLRPGVYIVKVTIGDETYSKKIIKK